MNSDQKPTESLGQKLLVAFVQILIFGVILAVIGYQLNLRLEANKQALAIQTAKTKTLLATLEPTIQLRRSAYLDLQSAARDVEQILEFYYFPASDSASINKRQDQLSELYKALGLPPSGGGSGSFGASRGEAYEAVAKLTRLQDKYQNVSSETITAAVDTFLDAIKKDLLESVRPGNDTTTFNDGARARLREAFGKLNGAIEDALGFRELPVR